MFLVTHALFSIDSGLGRAFTPSIVIFDDGFANLVVCCPGNIVMGF